jgi:hypothetical protein
LLGRALISTADLLVTIIKDLNSGDWKNATGAESRKFEVRLELFQIQNLPEQESCQVFVWP